MILVDTSVWIDHLRSRNETLAALLEGGEVLVHPFVIGELALGHLRQRDLILMSLQDLPCAKIASDPEVLRFIGERRLFGLGVGYVDAHLLAAALLTAGTLLWTLDARLLAAAKRLGVAARL